MNEHSIFTHVPESAINDEEMEIALAGTLDEEKLSQLLAKLESQVEVQSERLRSQDENEAEKARATIARIMKWQEKIQDEMTERAKQKRKVHPFQDVA